MSKHTPAPWKIINDNTHRAYEGAEIGTDNKTVTVIECALEDAPDEEEEANARRIVACVNACEGIPTEALECQTKRRLTEQLIECSLDMLSTLDNIETTLAGHPDINVGNSKVHYVYHRARGAAINARKILDGLAATQKVMS